MFAERLLFFNKFMKEPGKIGSITPSSSFLAKKLLLDLPWHEINTLVELGAGTGVFTQFIAQHKGADCQVFVVEQDDAMRESLQRQYPCFQFGCHAERLHELLYKSDLAAVDCIISGLPFAVFPEELQEKIVMEIKCSLRFEGVFVAFQYSLQMHKLLKRHFSEVEIGFELLNMPPAFVYHCKK